ncbi:MAG: cyclic pyranopterin monophosphate synthase MoaC [Limnochordia bacterium]|jgi:cyclic pyranopterin phosphate synthase
MAELTHFGRQGRARMVDVSEKGITKRQAIARGTIKMARETLELVAQGQMAKGDVLAVAQVAGIMGAKETGRLIPMCHPLVLDGVDVEFSLDGENSCIHIQGVVTTIGRTGVEMEALTAVSLAALTIYDMCKAVDREMTIENIRLVKKTGGKRGDYLRSGENGDEFGNSRG